jgi:Fic family protein
VTADPLAPLLDLPDVADAAAAARESIDRLLGHRALRRTSGPVSAESVLRGARASAALEGADYDLDAVRAGTVTDPVVQGALRVGGGLGPLVDTWERAPGQVLAKLHVLAAAGTVEEASLGRPVASAEVTERLAGLARLVAGGTSAPAVIVAAVVHGELLTLAPFPGPNGLVARAAARLTLVTRGLDPKAVSVPEAGHIVRQPEYVGAANAYATGTPDGVRAWIKHCCAAVALGADEGFAICEQLAA